MDMIAVVSSNVESIGYNAECELMRVRFKDGSLYDYPGISAELHERVMAAQSKGRALHAIKYRAVKIQPGDKLELREPALASPTSTLQTIEPDECCTRRFAKVAVTGALDKSESWTCPGCGVEYRPEMIEGTVRHWRAYVWMELVHPK